ncbi:hypothetical protein [Acinetobacter sp.]|uniref:hypothetical protein n=1 Tax=Acinetobacter sp. TaxID=472 RepID=UPI000C08FBA4|nr:hypothetical protein [Acinetobacter sp.]MAK30926.1 hypothetical protein [Acinetobacter sp.]
MSEEQEVEEVTLTEEDMAVIDEINNEHTPEEVEDTEDISVEETEETSQDISTESVEESTPQQTIPDDMMQAAHYYGLNVSDFQSQESLARVIDQFIVNEQNAYNYYAQQQQTQSGDSLPSADEIAEQFKIGLGDDYDEGLREAINRLAGNITSSFDQRMQYMQDQLAYQQQFVDQAYIDQSKQMAQGQIDQFDSAVSGLKHKALFGDKPYQELDPNSSEAQNMSRLFDQMTVLANGYQASGQSVPSYNDLVQQAYRAVFGNEIESLNRRRTNDRIRKAAKRKLGGGQGTRKVPDVSEDPVNNVHLKEVFEGYLKENGDL